LDDNGRPQFYDLLCRRSKGAFVAFDIAETGGRDVRCLRLIERKLLLRRNVGTHPHTSSLLEAVRQLSLFERAAAM
jgi:hypothetical protein